MSRLDPIHRSVVAWGMEQHDPTLLDQVNGVISLADVAWRLPPGRSASLARKFRLIGLVFEASAAVQKRDMLRELQITYDDIRQ